MIGRIWRGWTTTANADAYQTLLCTEIVPAIEARSVAGLLAIDLLRRDVVSEEHGDEVEFTTLLIFDSMAAVGRFAGEPIATAVVPPAARALLTHFDAEAAHHDIIERRWQTEHARGRA